MQSVLENYRVEESVGGGEDRHASQHNWVDEIARCEGRPGLGGGNDVNISSTTVRLRPARNSSALTRYVNIMYASISPFQKLCAENVCRVFPAPLSVSYSVI